MVVNKKVACSFGLMIGLGCTTSHATLVTLDLPGTNFTLSYEDSQPAVSLWGAPTVLGQTIQLTPPGLAASVIGPTPPNSFAADDAFSTIEFSIMAKDGFRITQLDFSERGEFTRLGGVFNQMTAGGALSFDELGSPVTAFFNFDVTGLDVFGEDLPWSYAASYTAGDIGSASLTGLQVSIENDLQVALAGDAGDEASIEKALAELTVVTEAVVPAPPPAALLLGGLLAWYGVARRRANQVGANGSDRNKPDSGE